jgi:Flp pilus assembly protein TadG
MIIFNKKSRESGANLIETAILVPLLLLFLVGVADFGRAYHTYITMINAAREGARLAVGDPGDSSAIHGAVLREAQDSNIDLSGAVISIVTAGAGHPVRVTIQLDYNTLLGIIIGVPNFPMKASATFRVRG